MEYSVLISVYYKEKAEYLIMFRKHGTSNGSTE